MQVTPSPASSNPGTTGQTPAARPKKVKDHRRSRVTNGSELLPGIDGRSPTAKRYKDLIDAITVDQGGADLMSEARMQLIRRFAAAACLAEQMEAVIVAGGQIDLEDYAKLSSTLVRLVNHLGLERVPRDVTGLVTETIDGHIVEPQLKQSESATSLRNRLTEVADAE
ncbi:MAG: hypothetical protein WA858_30975 [Xanthobacteraceae bacterium]|jgi:hypothetical protein